MRNDTSPSNNNNDKHSSLISIKTKTNTKEIFRNVRAEIYNLPLQNQILSFFLIFYFIYLIFLIFMKNLKLTELNSEISDMTYFKSVGVEYLLNLKESYEMVYSVSFDSNMTHFTRGMNFFNIYSRELNRLGLNLLEPNSNFPYVLNTLDNINFTSLNKVPNQRLDYILNGKFSEYFRDLVAEPKAAAYNNSLLFPMLHTNIPNIIQDANSHNLRLETITTVSSSFITDACIPNTSPNYFAFPNREEGFENFNLMDEMIDPHSNCEKIDPSFSNIYQDNFYKIFEKNFILDIKSLNTKKILNIFQILESDQHYSNFFSYLSSNKFRRGIINSLKYDLLTFTFNFFDDFSKINLDNNITSHFSIFYFNNNLIDGLNMKNSSNKSYNIINIPNTVITIPQFLESLYTYGFKTNKYFLEYSDDEKAIINTQDIFSRDIINKLVNPNFELDSKIFPLISFLENSYIRLNNDQKCILNYDPAVDFGLENEKECFQDLCFFNKCMGTEKMFDPYIYLKGNIDCKCLPVYCGDYLINKIINMTEKMNNPSANVSYQSTQEINEYKDYTEFNQTIFESSFKIDYFENLGKNKNLNCKLHLTQKEYFDSDVNLKGLNESISYYQIDMLISKKPFSSDGTFVILYMYNLNDFIYGLYKDFYKEIKKYNISLFIVYSVLIVLLSFICLNKFFNNIKKFRERISGLSEHNILSAINKINERKNLIRINRQLSKLPDVGKDHLFQILFINLFKIFKKLIIYNKYSDNYDHYISSDNTILKGDNDNTNANNNDKESSDVIYNDEVEDIKNFILDNIYKFCISFTNKVVFHEKHPIFVKYINKIKKEIMIKTNFDQAGYSKKMVNEYFSKSYFDFFLIENISENNLIEERFKKIFEDRKTLIKEYDSDKKIIYKDYSCTLLIELISTEIDLRSIFSNFYYKDPLNNQVKFELYSLMEKLEDDSQVICESSDLDKMKKFVSFVNEIVIFKWHLELQKKIFNDYYYK